MEIWLLNMQEAFDVTCIRTVIVVGRRDRVIDYCTPLGQAIQQFSTNSVLISHLFKPTTIVIIIPTPLAHAYWFEYRLVIHTR